MNSVDRMSVYEALSGRMVINENEWKGSRCITVIHVPLFFTYISLIKIQMTRTTITVQQFSANT